MDIGRKIKNLRLEKGLSQEELAKRIGVSRESISHYENNRIVPPIHILKEIAKVFNISVKYFFEEDIEEEITEEDNTLDLINSLPSNALGFMVFSPKIRQKRKEIPVYRFPIPSDGEPEYRLIIVRLIEYLERNDVDFALRLNSDVMEPYIPQGALLLVKKRVFLKNGELIVYRLNGKFGVRWYIENNGEKILAAENRKYKDIIIKSSDDFMFVGVVLDVLFDFKPHKEFL